MKRVTETIVEKESLSAADAACASFAQAQETVESAGVEMGRTLHEVQDKELYKPEYHSFEAFTQAMMEKHRIGRTLLRNWMMIVETMPELEPSEAAKIPPTSLVLVARAARTATPRRIVTMLRDASTLSVGAFKAKLAPQLVSSKPAVPTGVVIRLVVPKTVAQRWQTLIDGNDPVQVFSKLVGGAARAIRKAA